MADITYEARYPETSAPTLCKVITLPDGEEFTTALNLSNTDEIANVDDVTIRLHMENLVAYLKHLADHMSLVPENTYPEGGWPVIGWVPVSAVNDDITKWWTYIEFREEQALHLIDPNALSS